MAEDLYRVELTARLLERLDAIDAFSTEADATFAFDDLLAELRATVFPNLARFPRTGRRYLDNAPQSTEAQAQLAKLPVGAASALREYLHGDYLMLYTVVDTPPEPSSRCICCPSGITANFRLTSPASGLLRNNEPRQIQTTGGRPWRSLHAALDG